MAELMAWLRPQGRVAVADLSFQGSFQWSDPCDEREVLPLRDAQKQEEMVCPVEHPHGLQHFLHALI